MLVVLVLARAGGTGAPPDAAATLVPRSALVYLHVSTDTGRAATSDALAVLRRFPSFEKLQRSLVDGLRRFGRGTGVEYGRDIAPWIGEEAALALLPSASGTTAAEFVIGVRSRPGAEGFLLRLGRPSGLVTYKGMSVRLYGGQALTFAGRFLIAGTLAAVRAGIDAAADGREALAGSPRYVRARAGAPADRVADLWASGDGVSRVLAPRSGLLGVLGTVLSGPGLEATDVSLSAGGNSARVRIHAVRAPGRPPSFAGVPLRPVTPSLPAALPGPALALADVGGMDAVLARLAPLLPAELNRAARILSPLLTREAALEVLPRGRGQPPVLLLVAPVTDLARARRLLAAAQAPLTALLGPLAEQAGRTPAVSASRVGGAVVNRIQTGTGFEIDSALVGRRLVLATDPGAIAALVGTGPRAGDPARFRAVLPPRRGRTTALVFLDLKQLLAFGERIGLAQDPRYQAVRDDLRLIAAAGLRASAGPTDSTAEISLQIP